MRVDIVCVAASMLSSVVLHVFLFQMICGRDLFEFFVVIPSDALRLVSIKDTTLIISLCICSQPLYMSLGILGAVALIWFPQCLFVDLCYFT